MVRAGLIRQVGAGLWTWLPAGWRVHQTRRADRPRGDGRDRRPGDADAGAAAGRAVEAHRAATSIDELFKLQDRKGAELVLAMTHEEVVTTHVAQVVRSYRDLPLILYHFQIKERDEPRPRAGVLRTREFIMKDAYTFDRDAEGLDARYEKHIVRLRPHLRPLRAGVVPGRVRRRDDGRPRRARVHGAVRGGRERGRARAGLRGQRRGRRAPSRSRSSCPGRSTRPRRSRTPGLTTVDEVARRARRAGRRAAQGLPGRRRGPRAGAGARARRPPRQRDQAPQRARRATFRAGARGRGRASASARPASSARSAPTSPILLDDARGAGGGLRHRRQPRRRPPARRRARAATSPFERADVRTRRGGRHASTGSAIRIEPAIEVGNIFKLGTRYSEPLGATYLDEDGTRAARSGWAPTGSARRASPPPRSSSSPTSTGISWPRALAPFDVELVALGKPGTRGARARRAPLRRAARGTGLEVLYDDRDAGAGREVRRRRAARLPAAVTVGRRTLEPASSRSQVRRGREARSRAAGGRARRRWTSCGGRLPERAHSERVERARLTTRRLLGPRPLRARRRPRPCPGQPLHPWTIPNAIGFVRLALIPVFLVARATAPTTGTTALAAAIFFAVIGWRDYLDGIAARVTGQYSRLGALLDPLVDRLLVVSAWSCAGTSSCCRAGRSPCWSRASCSCSCSRASACAAASS